MHRTAYVKGMIALVLVTIVAVAIVVGLGTTSLAQATTIVVTPVASPTVDNNDFTVIQAAVAAAGAGDTIDLQGTFDWTETNAYNSYFGSYVGTVYGDIRGVEIPGVDNLTITSSTSAHIIGPGDIADVPSALIYSAFLFSEQAPGNTNLTISNLFIDDFEGPITLGWNATGIFDGTVIEDNEIVVAGDDGDATDWIQNIAIYFWRGTGQTIQNNTITFQADGTRTEGYSGPKPGASFGYQCGTSGGTGYDGLLITGNVLQVGATSNATEQVYGIWENSHNDDDSTDIAITNNQFLGRAGDDFDHAFLLSSQTDGLVISGNILTGVDNLFHATSSQGHAVGDTFTFGANTLSSVGGADGIVLQNVTNNDPPITITINWHVDNSIDGYTGVRGLNELAGAATDLDAVNAVGAEPTATYVDDDWAAAGRFTDPDGIGAGVDPLAFGYNAFSLIQDAVDASATAGTVNVSAGTYVEQVEIAKALTLSGAGPTTIIESPDDMAIYFTTGTNNNYPIVYVHDTDGVVIQDLAVDGAGKGNLNYRFIGIGYRNAGGTVQRVAIDDICDTPFSGAQHGVALYVYNDDLVSRTINVYDSTMAGFQKNGMALNAGDTTPLVVDVQRNVVTGAGVTTVTAQNGIQVWADLGSGTVADNVVDGIAYAGSGWVASSILNYYADLDITGNTITNAHMGIYNIDGAGLISGNDLSIVNPGGFAYGIVATDPPHAVPAPFVEDDGVPHAAPTGQTIQTTLAVEISNNTVVLDDADSTSTYGIEADGGYSANDLALDIDGNTVANFEVGIEIYKCQSNCDTGVFLSVSANDNNLGGNGYGIRSNDTTITVDGRYNWWGSPSGPYHPTLNPSGSGSWVSDNVNFEPYFLPTWQKYAGNPVVTGSMAFDPCVIKDGATYKMWYTHVDNSGNWTIYYATSADGVTWANQQQVLAPAGTWEGARVLGPSVIFDGTTYRMWYTGRDASGVYSIGYADSADGITWANRQQVLTATAGAWDAEMVREPWVVLDGTTYKMWYEGTDLWPNFAIGYAESTDGVNWTKHASNPVFSGTAGGWDGFQVYAPSVVLDNGTYHMYFSGTDANMSQRWSTGHATSSDGLTWTEASRNPILIPEGDDSLDYVSAMNDDGVWKIWYSYGGTYAIGLATMEFGTELYIDPPVASIPNDNTTTQVYTIQMVNAVDVYGYQFVFTFDPVNVEAAAAAFDNSFFDTPMGAPPGWDATIDNVNGRVYFARTRQYPQDGVSGSGPLATITLRGKPGAAADQYRLDFDMERLGTVDGDPIDVTTQHGWLTLYGAGNLEGTVDLQGRPDESGAVVTIMTAGGYLASQTITDPAGAWSFSGVPAGSYQVNIEMERYLDSQKGASGSGVAVPAGGTATLNQLRMLGGDADDDDTVDISDAVIIGSMYGLTAPADARADINNDGVVDVLDLVLMGGNFTKTSPTTWL